MKFYQVFLLFSLWAFNPASVSAQSLPTVMQRSVSSVIQNKMVNRGFASSDPRWAITLQGSGTAIAGAAATAAVITASGVSAPAWVTAAATAALGSLLYTGLNLAVDGIKWLVKADGSVITQTGSSVIVIPAGKCLRAAGSGSACWGSVTDALTNGDGVQQYYDAFPQAGGVKIDGDSIPGWWTLTVLAGEGFYLQFSKSIELFEGTPNAVVLSDSNFYSGSSTSTTTLSPSAAVASLNDSDRAKKVNPEIITSIANEAWKRAAAQPGYEGVPFDETNPITVGDVRTWLQNNPQAWPSVAALVSPQPAPSGGTSADPFKLPNNAAQPAPTEEDKPPAEVKPELDWSIPDTSEKIKQQQVSVSYVPTVFAAPTGCPAPIPFVLFEKQFFISYEPFCDLMAIVAPIFLALGAATAAIIFMQSLKS